MQDPKTLKSHLNKPSRESVKSRGDGGRTMADLMNDPRFIAARERAAIPDDRQKPYTPPSKPIRRYTDEELTEAMDRCSGCGGMGFIARTWTKGNYVGSNLSPCPQCVEIRDEQKNRRDMASMRRLVDKYSMLRGNLLTRTFENFISRGSSIDKAKKAVYAWARNAYDESGSALPWLFISGPPGTGKTHLGAAAANGLLSAAVPTIFTTFPQLLGMVSANHFDKTEATIAAAQNVRVLILDDIRAENMKSPWASGILFRILDHRYVTQSPTMIVSNHPLTNPDPTRSIVTLEDLEARVASRLGDKSLSLDVTIIGPDFRTQNPQNRS